MVVGGQLSVLEQVAKEFVWLWDRPDSLVPWDGPLCAGSPAQEGRLLAFSIREGMGVRM